MLANYLLLNAGFGFTTRESTLFIAFFSIAWVVGVATFIMPAGIGVREAVFVLLATQLGQSYSLKTLATIAIMYRFWQIFHEVGGLIVAFVLKQWRR